MYEIPHIRIGKCARVIYTEVNHGTIVTKDNVNGDVYVEKIKVENQLTTEHKIIKNGKYSRWIKYGEFDKERKDGHFYNIMHYRRNTACGKHGLCMRNDFKLEGNPGRCYTFFTRGKLIWQKFVYPNNIVAYYMRWTDTEIKGMHPNKKPMFEIKVNRLYIKDNKLGDPFIYHQHNDAAKYNLSADGIFCSYKYWDKRGCLKVQGEYEKNQRKGEWIEDYKPYFYLNGLPVPKDFYEKDPKDINPSAVLEIKNSQVRAMFLKKVGYDRVVKECNGKIIHKDGNYALIDFLVDVEDRADESADKILRILKVQCPSTKSEYFLPVPPTEDFNTCAKARNGTFTHFEPKAKEVEFALET